MVPDTQQILQKWWLLTIALHDWALITESSNVSFQERQNEYETQFLFSNKFHFCLQENFYMQELPENDIRYATQAKHYRNSRHRTLFLFQKLDLQRWPGLLKVEGQERTCTRICCWDGQRTASQGEGETCAKGMSTGLRGRKARPGGLLSRGVMWHCLHPKVFLCLLTISYHYVSTFNRALKKRVVPLYRNRPK